MTHSIIKLLAIKLRRERLRCNMSQETLAHKAHLSRNFIGMIERGERNVTVATLADIAKAMNMEAWELLQN